MSDDESEESNREDGYEVTVWDNDGIVEEGNHGEIRRFPLNDSGLVSAMDYYTELRNGQVPSQWWRILLSRVEDGDDYPINEQRYSDESESNEDEASEEGEYIVETYNSRTVQHSEPEEYSNYDAAQMRFQELVDAMPCWDYDDVYLRQVNSDPAHNDDTIKHHYCEFAVFEPGPYVVPYESDEQERVECDKNKWVDHGPFTDHTGTQFQHSFRMIVSPTGETWTQPFIDSVFEHITPEHEAWNRITDYWDVTDDEGEPMSAWIIHDGGNRFWDAKDGPPRVCLLGCYLDEEGSPSTMLQEYLQEEFAIEVYDSQGEVVEMPKCEYAGCPTPNEPLPWKVENGNYALDEDKCYSIQNDGGHDGTEYVCRKCCQQYLIEQITEMSVEDQELAKEDGQTPFQMLEENGDFSIPEGVEPIVVEAVPDEIPPDA